MDVKIIKTLEKRLAGPTFLKYIEVSSVDEYFALPKSARELYGLYRKPFALPIDRPSFLVGNKSKQKGWNAWEKEIKRLYPVQWFVREWCFSWENPVYSFFKGLYFDYREKKYAVKRFIKPFYPRFRKSMPRHQYTDVSEALRKVNFALLLDFWYDEMVDGIVDWNDNNAHKDFFKRVKAAVKYIELERPALEKKSDATLTSATDKKKGTYEQRYAKHNAIEAKIAQKDTDLLVWMMQQREMFWT
jgi:hypothetical protein